jgi:hypothetical protein
MRRLLMRVFSAELRSLFLPWAEVGPLKGLRSRRTGIPRYPEHRQQWRIPTKDFVSLAASLAREKEGKGE